MKHLINVYLLLATILLSCSNTETKTGKISGKENHEEGLQKKNMNYDSIVNILQGKWKENEYPFRTVEFRNNTAKFIEEGVAEKTAFKKFSISDNCSFPVNNIDNAGADDIFLVLEEDGRCEILKASNDVLILGGYNTSSKQDYEIRYSRIKNK